MLTMNDILNPQSEHIVVGDYIRSKCTPNLTGIVTKVIFSNNGEDNAYVRVVSRHARGSGKSIILVDLKYWEKC